MSYFSGDFPFDSNASFIASTLSMDNSLYAVSEFQDMAIDDIMSCIGNDIEIGSKPLSIY